MTVGRKRLLAAYTQTETVRSIVKRFNGPIDERTHNRCVFMINYISFMDLSFEIVLSTCDTEHYYELFIRRRELCQSRINKHKANPDYKM